MVWIRSDMNFRSDGWVWFSDGEKLITMLLIVQAPRCRCLRTNHARMVETGVQVSRDSTGNEEFV